MAGARIVTGRILSALIAILFLSPFLILFGRYPSWNLLPTDELARVFGFTALQAGASAIVSLSLGFVGALGLMAFPRRTWFRAFALLPNAVPALLVILASMNIWPGIRGLAGIVIVHTLLNAGIVAVAVAALLSTRFAGMADLALIEGAGRWAFLRRGALPLLAPDLSRLFLFVFAVCFSSFAVPLVIGGSRATTVEVLIFEQIRIAPDWSTALGLAALQTLAILLLSVVAGSKPRAALSADRSSPLLEWKPGVAFALAPAAVVVAGLVLRLPQGFAQLSSLAGFSEELPELISGSFFVAIMTGGFCAVGLLALMVARPEGITRRFLLGFVAPSSVLTGFAMLLLWRETGWASLVKISIGLALISVPAFYRLRWDGAIAALEGQVTVARTLGASERQIVSRILLPQLWPTCMFLAGLGAFWAWGDFALSAVVGERALTLAMFTEGLLGSYRLGLATVMVFFILIGGTLTFGLFWGAGRVLGTRTQT